MNRLGKASEVIQEIRRRVAGEPSVTLNGNTDTLTITATVVIKQTGYSFPFTFTTAQLAKYKSDEHLIRYVVDEVRNSIRFIFERDRAAEAEG